ncbi:31754_t:CDS:2, partial [Racocetra persica]
NSSNISIIQIYEDKLEISQEAYNSDEDNFFNTYESETNLDEIESYYIDDKLGQYQEIQYEIDTSNARPIKQSAYQALPNKQDFLNKEIEKLLNN